MRRSWINPRQRLGWRRQSGETTRNMEKPTAPKAPHRNIMMKNGNYPKIPFFQSCPKIVVQIHAISMFFDRIRFRGFTFNFSNFCVQDFLQGTAGNDPLSEKPISRFLLIFHFGPRANGNKDLVPERRFLCRVCIFCCRAQNLHLWLAMEVPRTP